MANLPSFSATKVQEAISSASNFYQPKLEGLAAGDRKLEIDDGHASLLAECITLTLKDGKACVNLPLGIGSVCIPIPISYDGQVAQACLSICTTWGIPTGVRVTVSVAGVTIVSKTFLKC